MLLETKEKYAARPYEEGEQGATNADGPGKCRVVRLCNRVAEKAMPRCVALGHTRPIICLTSKHYRVARDYATCQQRRGCSRYYRGCEKPRVLLGSFQTNIPPSRQGPRG